MRSSWAPFIGGKAGVPPPSLGVIPFPSENNLLESPHAPSIVFRFAGKQGNLLPTCDSSQNDKRFSPGNDFFGEWRIRRFVGQVLIAGKKPQKRSSFFSSMISNGSNQYRISGFNLGQDRTLGYRRWNIQLDLPIYGSQGLQVKWQNNSNHGKV